MLCGVAKNAEIRVGGDRWVRRIEVEKVHAGLEKLVGSMIIPLALEELRLRAGRDQAGNVLD